MPAQTVPQLVAEIREVRQCRNDALDRIEADMQAIAQCDYRIDTLLERRRAITARV